MEIVADVSVVAVAVLPATTSVPAGALDASVVVVTVKTVASSLPSAPIDLADAVELDDVTYPPPPPPTVDPPTVVIFNIFMILPTSAGWN